jgi:hypothetical protein
MKRPELETYPLPLHDYDPALKSAMTWLGDRYLLATPQPRRPLDPARHGIPARRSLRDLKAAPTRH